jgi:multiple sugar transport system ATP-binding protein
MSQVEFDRIVKRFSSSVTAVRDLTLRVEDGEFLVLLGPSGCGKTTALRMLAGLEDPDEGDIRIDGESVVDLEPKDRDIALVFQNYALYPHLTARNNLLYPLKIQKIPPAERIRRIDEAAALLGITHLLERKPAQLSGGEQQRVALGRAIVRQPRVFLMDEPLSNLDAMLRIHMRTEIRTLQQRLGVTTVFVTHDQAEAMSMADRIAVMRSGELQQLGRPDDVYQHPSNLFVAQFIGSPPMNVLDAELVDGELLVAGCWRLPLPGAPSGMLPTSVKVGLRPEAIQLDFTTSARAVAGEVLTSEPLGSEVIVNVQLGPSLVKVRVAPEIRPLPGQAVYLSAAARGLRVFDADSGRAITFSTRVEAPTRG